MATARLGKDARKIIAENLGNNTNIKKIEPEWPSFRRWVCEQCKGQSRFLLSFLEMQSEEDFQKQYAVGLQRVREVKKYYLSFCSDLCIKKFWNCEDSIEYVRSEIRSELGRTTVGFTDYFGSQFGWLNNQHYGPHD